MDDCLGEVSHGVHECHCRECLGGDGNELEVIGPVAVPDVFEEAGEEDFSGREIGLDCGVRRHEQIVTFCVSQVSPVTLGGS